MPDVDLGAVSQSLYTRRHEALVVPFEHRDLAGGSPDEHHCHCNVDRWVLEHPNDTAVRGWLVFDLNKTSQRMWPICRFTAHSVIETSDGRLIDITPSQASKRYPFLRRKGPEEEFVAIVEAGHIHLDCTVRAG